MKKTVQQKLRDSLLYDGGEEKKKVEYKGNDV